MQIFNKFSKIESDKFVIGRDFTRNLLNRVNLKHGKGTHCLTVGYLN